MPRGWCSSRADEVVGNWKESLVSLLLVNAKLKVFCWAWEWHHVPTCLILPRNDTSKPGLAILARKSILKSKLCKCLHSNRFHVKSWMIYNTEAFTVACAQHFQALNLASGWAASHVQVTRSLQFWFPSFQDVEIKLTLIMSFFQLVHLVFWCFW
jgi:hypothetical protein